MTMLANEWSEPAGRAVRPAVARHGRRRHLELCRSRGPGRAGPVLQRPAPRLLRIGPELPLFEEFVETRMRRPSSSNSGGVAANWPRSTRINGTFQIDRGDQQLATEHTGYAETFVDGTDSESTQAHNGIPTTVWGRPIALTADWPGKSCDWRARTPIRMPQSTSPSLSSRDPRGFNNPYESRTSPGVPLRETARDPVRPGSARVDLGRRHQGVPAPHPCRTQRSSMPTM